MAPACMACKSQGLLFLQLMYKILLISMCMVAAGAAQAQLLNARGLVKVMELDMGPGSTGVDGASVAWHPVHQVYIAGMTGGPQAPLCLFDAQGKKIDSTTTQVDLRGLWYNPNTREIEGNRYDSAQVFTYALDKKGKPQKVVANYEGETFPEAQSIATVLPQQNMLLFLQGTLVNLYDLKTADFLNFFNIADLHAKEDFKLSEDEQQYNSLVILTTNQPGRELALLNIQERTIELFDVVKGGKTFTLFLPKDQPTYGAFNAAYANGIFWLFDNQRRVWNGYQ